MPTFIFITFGCFITECNTNESFLSTYLFDGFIYRLMIYRRRKRMPHQYRNQIHLYSPRMILSKFIMDPSILLKAVKFKLNPKKRNYAFC